MHKIEIAAESLTYVESKAEIFIKTIVITGIDIGGAAMCQKCPANSVSFGKQSHCTKCPAGFQANAQFTACEPCPEGHFSSKAGEECKPCPINTLAFSNTGLFLG